MSAQKLILPIEECRLTASWQNPAYEKEFDYGHYGADFVSVKLLDDDKKTRDRTLIASGRGSVISIGKDGVAGNVVIIKYPNVLNHKTAEKSTVIFRYCHLATIQVSPYQEVQRGTVIGSYGATGMYEMAPHLHLEASTDIRNPHRTPTVKISNFLKRATEAIGLLSMFNVLDVLYISRLEGQSFSTANDSYINEQDKYLPSTT